MRPFEKQKRISDKGQAPRKSGPALLDYVNCEIKPPASPVRSLTFILKSEKISRHLRRGSVDFGRKAESCKILSC
jgi:hypothetical protein